MNFPLLLHFVRKDLIDRHAASALGAAWTLLLPLSNILIFTLVFSRFMGMRLQLQRLSRHWIAGVDLLLIYPGPHYTGLP